MQNYAYFIVSVLGTFFLLGMIVIVLVKIFSKREAVFTDERVEEKVEDIYNQLNYICDVIDFTEVGQRYRQEHPEYFGDNETEE